MKKIYQHETLLHHYVAVLGGYVACTTLLGICGSMGTSVTAIYFRVSKYILTLDLFHIAIALLALLHYILGNMFFIFMKKKSHKNLQLMSLFLLFFAVLIYKIPYIQNEPMLMLCPILFASAFQYSAFPGNEKFSAAVSFCSNNTRQASFALMEYILEGNREMLEKCIFFSGTLCCFFIGGFISCCFLNYLPILAEWNILILEIPALLLCIHKSAVLKDTL